MNAILKVKTTTHCRICCCRLPRVKSFKVEAADAEAAKLEAASKIAEWKSSLVGQECRVCASIVSSLEP